MASAKEVISVRITRMCMLFLKCQVLGRSQRYLRCDQTLHDRIVCQVQIT